MITIQFDDPLITQIIQEEGIENITQELKKYIKNKFTPNDKNLLSTALDTKIRMEKSINKEKADEMQNAMESLSLHEAKERCK